MSDLSNLTNFIFNGSAPPQVTTYGSTTTGVPDWLAQGEIGLLNTAGGVSSGLSASGYPLAGLPQIGAFNPNYDQANGMVNTASSSWQPYVNQASGTNQWVMGGGGNPAAAAQGYFDQANQGYGAGLGANSLGLVSPYAQQAAGMSSVAAGSPYLQQGAGYANSAAGQNYLPLAQSYINQGVASNPLAAAAPLVNQATAPLTDQINQLMQGSFIPQENNALAQQSATNLSKYLLPASDSQFISNGQAGSSRNQDYDALTTAYANQGLLSQQAQNLQQGYQSAATTALGQQSNLGALAGTVGGLGAAQQQALMGAGTSLANIGYQGAQTQLGAAGQLGALGSTFGNLTSAQQQALLNSGSLLGSTNTSDISQKLQAAQGLTSLGSAAGQLTNEDVQNALQASSQQAGLGQQSLTSGLSGAQATDALGQEQQGYNTQAIQANNQNVLNTTNWTPQQLSWLSNILHGLPSAGTTSNTTNQGPSSVYSPSPASQLTGLALLGKYT